jgi:hypothetical protein
VCIFLLFSFAPPTNCLADASPLAAASLPPALKTIGRKQNPEDPNKLLARAKTNGYRRGEHREQDAVPNRHAHINKTVYDQDCALRRYVVYKGPSLLVYKWAPVLT